jgi:hypothetical protein
MASWTVERLLDHVQEIMGEPVGGFYNISTRLDQMNQAQRELNDETRAIVGTTDITVVSGTRDYDLPADFLTFSTEQPYFVDSAGQYHAVEVTDVDLMARRYQRWQDESAHVGLPTHLVVRNGTLTLYPTPNQGGTLTVPYVVEPTELAEMDDEPFNGLSHLNRFAPALAYKVAFVNAIGRAPQIAAMFQDLYERQERLMRHHVRSSPQHKPGVRPPQGEYHRGS